MNKHISTYICLLVLLSLPGCQSSGRVASHQDPVDDGMKMHIFTDETEPGEKLTISKSTDNQKSSDLNMIIFDDQANEAHQADSSSVTQVEDNQQTYKVTEDSLEPAREQEVLIRKNEKSFALDFSILPGYRQDNIKWSIAGLNGTPNILSELQWNDLKIGYLGGEINLDTPWNVVLQGRGGYGTIFDGSNQDSDYFGNDRTFEFSRSNNNSDSGYVWDASLAIGYQFDFIADGEIKPWFSVTPLAGYSYNEQHLRITDGFQTIPAFGPFPDLNSSYDTTWKGPWLGLDLDIAITDNVDLFTGFEYHFAEYEAQANWNLRTDFQHPVSFTHTANGYGIVASLGGRYRFTDYLALLLALDYQYWNANEDGVDTTFFSNGQILTTGLNEVKWQSFGVNLGLQLSF